MYQLKCGVLISRNGIECKGFVLLKSVQCYINEEEYSNGMY